MALVAPDTLARVEGVADRFRRVVRDLEEILAGLDDDEREAAYGEFNRRIEPRTEGGPD